MPETKANDSPVNLAVAREIAAQRARQRMSQREVYEAADVTPSSYVRYETGNRFITVEALTAICLALNTTPAELVREAQQHAPEAFGLVH